MQIKQPDRASHVASSVDYQAMMFDYARSPDQDCLVPVSHPVVIVGAGPVGLSLAIDLARKGHKVVLLDNDCKLSTGSRAICFAKRTLEIFDRLGVGDKVAEKGVSWNVGKVFFKDRLTYQFDLLAEAGHKHPAFFNIQQFYVEGFLVEQALAEPNIDLRWMSKVIDVVSESAGPVSVMVETPDGQYRLQADYVVACDGSRSSVRQLMGLESKGRVFQDCFLIADVTMKAEFPTERWFWFDPPFHRNQSVLLHKQPDGQWRIDFQLGWDADPEEERKPEKIRPRIQALLGGDAQFELTWASVYTFACLRMESFQLGRVFFAGDAAHGVSPFGARGANSGIQDAENLAWKLDLVLRGLCSEGLLRTYGLEREFAADENILNSTRATDFITPKSEISRLFRDTTLELAQDFAFARRLVNSGRLSTATHYGQSTLNFPCSDEKFPGGPSPGSPAIDAPVGLINMDSSSKGWLLDQLYGGFVVLVFSRAQGTAARGRNDELTAIDEEITTLCGLGWPVRCLRVGIDTSGAVPDENKQTASPQDELLRDVDGLVASRYGASEGTVYLIRPDQHVLARWRDYSSGELTQVFSLLSTREHSHETSHEQQV